MKGIILSGGHGTRLYPLTKVTSKQLLPIYDKPMIYYPLNTLLKAGIKDILVIVAPEHAGDYLNFLGSGREFGARFTYEVQDKPEGLAQAFLIGESFIDEDDVTMILGDNIFEDDNLLPEVINNFKGGGHVFAKKVADPERFGVIKFNQKMEAQEIVEKPQQFISDYAQTGLYVYDKRVVQIAKNLKPSPRGELEIVDIAKWYLQKGELKVSVVEGEWIDAGTFDSLHKAANLAYKKAKSEEENKK
jgi:glucose-1-phosphate thymidylyltransferase